MATTLPRPRPDPDTNATLPSKFPAGDFPAARAAGATAALARDSLGVSRRHGRNRATSAGTRPYAAPTRFESVTSTRPEGSVASAHSMRTRSPSTRGTLLVRKHGPASVA